MNAQRELYKNVVDTSHKYTNVYASDYIGPGNAHHYYDIVHKEEGKLDRWLAELRFQNGPIQETGINGIMDENLIAILIDRIAGFQNGPYACHENGEALVHLNSALDALKSRTQRRISEGKEGTHAV